MMGRGRQRCESVPVRQSSNLVECNSEEEKRCRGYFALEEAPIFHPTEEEFVDPLRFIAQIREQAEPYGICRIVPPQSWRPPFALDSTSFTFPTKIQAIHQLQERPAACDVETFKLEYGRYLEKEGKTIKDWPQFEREDLDLCKLFNAVKRHGGYNKVSDEKKWGEVFRMLKSEDSPAVSSNSTLSRLRELYESHLYHYELYQANVGSGKLSRVTKKQEVEVKYKGKQAGRKRQTPIESDYGRKRRRVGRSEGAAEGKHIDEESEDPDPQPAVSGEQRVDQICEQCNSGAHEKSMLLCDRCNRGWHLYCLSPPLSAVPHGNWYCLDCVSSSNDSFGFVQGKEYTYLTFQRMAERFKRKWFGSRPAELADVEKELWRIVERATAPVEVLYGSDIDTRVYGSGFPRPSDAVRNGCDPDEWAAYTKNPWNLNNFPKLRGSMLRMVQDNIPGVIVPWLYMGMLFSSFCWHYEDHCFYSVNYLHHGAPKSWYSVPGSAVSDFEKVMQKAFPDLFEAQPDLLFQLVTMLSPEVVRDNGVPVCTTVQEPGNFVITFPRSYHGGFNHGFNCAEAVNFAPADWLPMGGFAVERYRFYHKRAVLSHDELLCVVAKNELSPETESFVQQELRGIVMKERAQREQLWSSGVVKSTRMAPRACQDHISMEEDPECVICRYYLHLSAVVCGCRPTKAVCLQHAKQLCECSTDQQRLLYRYSLAELDDLVFKKDANPEDIKVGALVAESMPTKRTLRRGAPSLNQSVSKKVNGRNMGLMKLAEEWLTKAQSVLMHTLTLAVVKELLTDVEQFLWAGHEMDPVRVVERTLAAACNWGEEVAQCWATVSSWLQAKDSRPVKVPFSRVQQLVTVDPVPCEEPHLASLKAFVGTAQCMQQQIVNLLSIQPPPQKENVEALLKEANQFPLEFEELPRLQQLVSLGKTWSERVRKLLPPIKALRNRGLVRLDQLLALQKEGLLLPVKTEDKEILDCVIKKAHTLKHRVNVMLGLVAPLQELEALVEEAHALPVQVPGLQELEQRLENVHAWLLRAKPALAHTRNSSDFGASITLLTDLLAAASTLHVQMDEVNVTQATQRKMQWMFLASKTIAERPSTKVIQYLLNEATRLQIAEEKLVLQVRQLAQMALDWESKAQQALKHGESFDNCVELISVASNISARLEGLSALKDMVAQASSLREQILPFVRKRLNTPGGDTDNRLQLSTLLALVKESQELKVRLEEVNLLHTYSAHAEAWNRNASILKTYARKALFETEEGDKPSGYTFEDSRIMLEKQLRNLQEAVKDGLGLGLDLPVIEELQTLCDAFTWSIRVLLLLHTQPALEEMESLWNEGRSFLSGTRQGALLQKTILRAQSWLQKVANVVPSYGHSPSCSEEQLEQLLEEAQALPVSLTNDVSHISQLLAMHRSWKEKVSQALSCSEDCLTKTELLQLQEDGVASHINSDIQQQLSAVLASAEAWLSSCYKAISSPSSPSSKTVKELLIHMGESVERAHQQLEGEDVECVCGGTCIGADSSMLQCDSCDGWYHPNCVGVSQFQTRVQKQYICPFCNALSTGILAFGDNSLKMHVTQRPSLAVLVELFNSANSICCRLEEQEMLQGLITAVHAWEAHVSEIIEPALHDCSTSVDVFSLLHVLKAVGTMEVQTEVNDRVKAAVATSTHAIRLQERPDKLSLRCTTNLAREDLASSVDEDDYMLPDLKQWESCASNWSTRAKQGLRTQSVLYCICQKPYDEEQAMIACDCCGKWYHYSCLQLPEPDIDEDLSDQHNSDDFMCPDCEDQARHVQMPLHCKEVDLLMYRQNFEETSCKVETPTYVEVPQAGSRGKRSSRAKTKAVSQHKWQYSHLLKSRSATNGSSEVETASTDRPCRRTAGRHSGFYLLLMRSC